MALLSKNAVINRRQYVHPGANNTITHEIDKGGFVHDIFVVARGNVVVSGGAADGVATGDYNPHNIVTQFELLANSKGLYPGGTLKRVSSRTVAARQIFDTGRFLGDNLGATINGAAGTYTIECVYHLRFAVPEFIKSAETALYTDQYNGLQLVISLGGRDTLFTGNNRNFDFSGVTFDIYDRRSSGSPFGDHVAVLYERDVIIPLNGANDSFNIGDYLDKPEPYYDILFISETTAAHTLTDALIKELKIVEDQSGTPFYRAIKPGILRYAQSQLIEPSGQAMTGLLKLNMAQDGMLKQLVASPRPVLDVANPGGPNLDRIIAATRCVVTPDMFLPSK